MATTTLNFGGDWRIRWDGSHNWILEENREVVNQKTKESRQDWVFVGYYGRLASALRSYVDKATQGLGEVDGAALLGYWDSLDRRIQNATKEA